MKKTNASFIEFDQGLIAKCTRAPYFPIVAKAAQGIYVEDMDGKKYIDMISSACVMNTGYNHQSIVNAAKKDSRPQNRGSNNQFSKFLLFSF